jgi:hypothetical protein
MKLTKPEAFAMANAQPVAQNQKPTNTLSAAQSKRLADMNKLKKPDQQVGAWAFALLSLIIDAFVRVLVKQGLVAKDFAVNIKAQGGQSQLQIDHSLKSASKAKYDDLDGEGRTVGVVSFGLSLKESQKPVLASKLFGERLADAAWLIIRAQLVAGQKPTEVEQAKLNACRQALNLAPAKPGKEAKAVAYAAHSNRMIKLAAKVGANPFGDTVKAVKEQSGKKTITINTNDKELGSLTTRGMEPDRAAKVRNLDAKFLVGAKQVHDLADALGIKAEDLTEALKANTVGLQTKPVAEVVEKKVKKVDVKDLINGALASAFEG